MYIVTVVPLKRVSFKGELTYFSSKNIELFSIVNIQIRGKNNLGIVVEKQELEDAKTEIKQANFNLKKVTDIKEKFIFKAEFIESAMLAGKYFLSNKNKVLSNLIPKIYKEEYDKIATFSNNSPFFTSESDKNVKAEKLLFQSNTEERLSFYKTLVRGSFADKKSVFFVLPTVKDIHFFEQKLFKGIEKFTFSFHGDLSTKEILKRLEIVLSTDHPVVILGTPPYLSIPRNDLANIVLEREGSNAYKSLSKMHFDMRLFVELYAAKTNTRLIIGDTLLSFETIAKSNSLSFGKVRNLSFRTNFQGDLEITNREKLKPTEKQKFKIITDENIEEIKKRLEKKENVFIFSLRKGLGSVTLCKDCGDTLLCEDCSAPLVLYLSKDKTRRMFVCNKCDKEKDPRTTCVSCGGWNLSSFGVGTDSVYEELKDIFPKTKIYRLDKESAKTNKGAEKITKEFEEGKGSILIGTELALIYLEQKVPLSIIASFDALWSIPNFKMSERIVGIILKIISKTDRKLIIQTKNEKDEAIQAIKNDNLAFFVRNELKDRETLQYPPYKRFIKLTYTGDKEETEKVKEFITSFFKNYNPLIFSAFTQKVKGMYITNVLIKIEPENWSLNILEPGGHIDEELFSKLSELKDAFDIRIDPDDLL